MSAWTELNWLSIGCSGGHSLTFKLHEMQRTSWPAEQLSKTLHYGVMESVTNLTSNINVMLREFLNEHCEFSGYHYCFVSWRSPVQNSAGRT